MGLIEGCKDSVSICESCKKQPKGDAIRVFKYQELDTATRRFSKDNLLGKGSHACVYKGVFQDGQILAIKRPNHGRMLLNDVSSFDNELEILSKVQHRHLVNMVGYCHNSSETLLVVELMANGTLHDILHCSSEPLSWPMRAHMALQAAKGVLALHSASPPVIHRDIKSSNILIDSNWEAKLGDLGLAVRGRPEDVVRQRTPPAGTIGYIDPEYETPSQLSTRADVFSFGVLLLEIVSGRNAIDVRYCPSSIIDWAVPLIKQGKGFALCDPNLRPPQDATVVKDLAEIAARCVRLSSERRPSMTEVVDGLKEVSRRIPLLASEVKMMKNTVIVSASRKKQGLSQTASVERTPPTEQPPTITQVHRHHEVPASDVEIEQAEPHTGWEGSSPERLRKRPKNLRRSSDGERELPVFGSAASNVNMSDVASAASREGPPKTPRKSKTTKQSELDEKGAQFVYEIGLRASGFTSNKQPSTTRIKVEDSMRLSNQRPVVRNTDPTMEDVVGGSSQRLTGRKSTEATIGECLRASSQRLTGRKSTEVTTGESLRASSQRLTGRNSTEVTFGECLRASSQRLTGRKSTEATIEEYSRGSSQRLTERKSMDGSLADTLIKGQSQRITGRISMESIYGETPSTGSSQRFLGLHRISVEGTFTETPTKASSQSLRGRISVDRTLGDNATIGSSNRITGRMLSDAVSPGKESGHSSYRMTGSTAHHFDGTEEVPRLPIMNELKTNWVSSNSSRTDPDKKSDANEATGLMVRGPYGDSSIMWTSNSASRRISDFAFETVEVVLAVQCSE